MNEHIAQPGGSNKVYAFSRIRAVACIAIILLHTVYGAVTLFSEETTQVQKAVSNVVVNNMMWAVPSFLMVSGALLLDPAKEITIQKIFRKYILRVVIALLAFSLIFRILEIVVNREPIQAATLLSGFAEFFEGTSWSHLWYLYLMVGLYLLLPFYKKITAHSSDTELRYLLCVYAVFLSVLPVLKLWNVKTGFYICTSTIYPFYFFCGYALHRGVFRINRGIALAFAVVGTAAVTGFTMLSVIGGVDGIGMLYNYSSIFVLLQSVGLFALLDREPAGEKLGMGKKLVLEVDSCSFGIYLIHMIFVRGVYKHTGIHPYGPGSVLILAGLVLGILLVSYVVTWVLKKIPGVRKIL